MTDDDIKRGTPNDASIDTEVAVPKITDEPVGSRNIVNKKRTGTFKNTLDNIKLPKLSKIESTVGRDIPSPKTDITNYLEKFILSGSGNLKNIRRRVDALTRLQIGYSAADLQQTRVEKFRELLSANRTTALFGLLQHASSVEAPYYKKHLALAYNQSELIKKLSSSINVLGQILETKLEAIKLNTSAPDANKSGLFERIRTEMRARQAKLIVDGTVGVLSEYIKKQLKDTLFGDKDDKLAYGTRLKDKIVSKFSTKKENFIHKIKEVANRDKQETSQSSSTESTETPQEAHAFTSSPYKTTVTTSKAPVKSTRFSVLGKLANSIEKRFSSPTHGIKPDVKENISTPNVASDVKPETASDIHTQYVKSSNVFTNPVIKTLGSTFRKTAPKESVVNTQSFGSYNPGRYTPYNSSDVPLSNAVNTTDTKSIHQENATQPFRAGSLFRRFHLPHVPSFIKATPFVSISNKMPSMSGIADKLSNLRPVTTVRNTGEKLLNEAIKDTDSKPKVSPEKKPEKEKPDTDKKSIRSKFLDFLHSQSKSSDNKKTSTDRKESVRKSTGNIYTTTQDRFERLRDTAKRHSFKSSAGKPIADKNTASGNAGSQSSGPTILGRIGSFLGDAVGDLLTAKVLAGGVSGATRHRGFFNRLKTRIKVGRYLKNKLGSRWYNRLGRGTVASGGSLLGKLGSAAVSAGKPIASGVEYVAAKPLAAATKYLGKGALNVGKDVGRLGFKGARKVLTTVAPPLLKNYAKANIKLAKLAGGVGVKLAKTAVPFAAGAGMEAAALTGKGMLGLAKKGIHGITRIPEGLDKVGKLTNKLGNSILKSKISSGMIRGLPGKLTGHAINQAGNLLSFPKNIKTASQLGKDFLERKAGILESYLGAGRSGISGKALRGVGRLGGGALRIAKGVLSPAAIAGIAMTSTANHFTKDGSFMNHALKTGGSALTWGATGAALGSIVPGIGTAAGAVIGAGAGALVENMKYVKQVGHYLYDSVVGNDTKIDPATGKVKKRGKHGIVNNLYTSIFGRKAKYGPDGEPELPKYGILERLSDFATGTNNYKKAFDKEMKSYKDSKKNWDKLKNPNWNLTKDKNGSTALSMVDPLTGGNIAAQFDVPKGSIVNNSAIDTADEYNNLLKDLPKELQDQARNDKALQYLIYAVGKNVKDHKKAIDMIVKNYGKNVKTDELSRKVFDQMSVEAMNSKDRNKNRMLSRIGKMKDYSQAVQSGEIAAPTITSAGVSFDEPIARTGDSGSVDISNAKPIKASRGLKANQKELIDALVKNEGIPAKNAAVIAANVSGESLEKPNDTSGDNHRAQGIVQWHPDRALPIKRRFGKFPYQMNLAEQAHAMVWEMQNNRMYRESFQAIYNPNISPEQLLGILVNNYERPKDRTGAIDYRARVLSQIKKDHVGYTDNTMNATNGIGTPPASSSKNMYAVNDNKQGSSPSATGSGGDTSSSTDNRSSISSRKISQITPLQSQGAVRTPPALQSTLSPENNNPLDMSKYLPSNIAPSVPERLNLGENLSPKFPEFPEMIDPRKHENFLQSINSGNQDLVSTMRENNKLLQTLVGLTSANVNHNVRKDGGDSVPVANGQNQVSPSQNRNMINQRRPQGADMDIRKTQSATG